MDGVDLSVIATETAVVALPYYLAVFDDQSAYHGVGTGFAQSPASQGERSSHVVFVVRFQYEPLIGEDSQLPEWQTSAPAMISIYT